MPIGALDNVFETALALGNDINAPFAEMGVTPEVVEDGSSLISSKQVAKLLLLASEATGRPDFPLLLAARQDMSDVSPLVLVMRTAPTLRHAFQKNLEFGHMYTQAVTWMLDSSRELERLCFSIKARELTPQQYRILAEFLLAQSYHFTATLIGETPRIERVLFAYSRLDYGSAFSRYFGAPIDYDAEVFGFDFVRGSLDKRLIYANEPLHLSVQKYLSTPGEDVEASLEQSVRAVIRSLLPSQSLTIESVARVFDCCDRTLQRRLKIECGVTYQKLVEEVRFDLVRQFLAQSKMSITDLAYAVGYSNSTNFTRAFKRVFGCTPREWRKEHTMFESNSSVASKELLNSLVVK